MLSPLRSVFDIDKIVVPGQFMYFPLNHDSASWGLANSFPTEHHRPLWTVDTSSYGQTTSPAENLVKPEDCPIM